MPRPSSSLLRAASALVVAALGTTLLGGLASPAHAEASPAPAPSTSSTPGEGEFAQGDVVARVVAAARQQVGKSYTWGGNGPDTFDCSGFTSYLWREVGGVTSIPRVSRDQQRWAVAIPVEQLRAGDLIFFGNPVSHVGLSIGGGRMVDASSSRKGVVERAPWTTGVVRYGRVPRPGMTPVAPWTPPSASPLPSTGSAPVDEAPPASPPAPSPSVSPTPTVAPLVPLAGLPAAPAAPSATALRFVANARTTLGSDRWNDLDLVRVAWRHAGGQVLPASRAAILKDAASVTLRDVRVGDLVAYGHGTALRLAVYVGAGYMLDASPLHRKVVIRRVYADPTVRFARLALPAPVLVPLQGLPAQPAAASPMAQRFVANARTTLGSDRWKDLDLVRVAWRHAGGALLPTDRSAVLKAATPVTLRDVRVGDLVAYGHGTALRLAVYVGAGYMLDASPLHGKVVIRRVYADPTVRFARLDAVPTQPAQS